MTWGAATNIGCAEHFRVTLAQAWMLDQHFLLVAKTGKVPLRAPRLLFSDVDVGLPNVSPSLTAMGIGGGYFLVDFIQQCVEIESI
jgi:hypothetical protein